MMKYDYCTMKKMMVRSYFIILISLIGISSYAQVSLPVPVNIQQAYNKQTRSIDGMPGKAYWQNKAVYNIAVQFIPETRLVQGNVAVEYVNNSPDTLSTIVFKLYPNIYKEGAPRLMSIDSADVGEGVSIESIAANNVQLSEKQFAIDATNMQVDIQPLPPHQSINFSIRYHYTLNKTSHIRTGEIEKGAFFIAYFFPRIAVYDDIDGWNAYPYLGPQEFYNDFCDFTVRITVPASYAVWATGTHTNRQSVFTKPFLDKIIEAERSKEVTTIADSAQLKNALVNATGNTEWIFESKHITDVVFAISDHYTWQSTSVEVDKTTGRRTRVDAVFNPVHKDYFNVVTDAQKTVQYMSERFPKWPFPYEHETVFDGLDQMEYPMMVNDNPLEDRAESIELTDHEIFHTMFPFYMGINETKYGWMDEGWATIGEWLITNMIDTTLIDEYGMRRYEAVAGKEADCPIMTLTTLLNGPSMFINSYPKPALAYLYLKDMLGDELFFKGLHHYINTWNGKHPMPYDFFYSMNKGTGKNLNWFWKRWFFDTGAPDMAITSFQAKKNQQKIVISMVGSKPQPIDITITYKDGSKEKIHRSVAVWETGNKSVTITFVSTKKVKEIHLGSTYVPDVNWKNNVYRVKR